MNEYNDMYKVMVESNNMGILFSRQGSYQMAAMFHLQALRIAESVMGKLSQDYCDSLYNLGNTFADAGNYGTALKYLMAAEQNAVMRGAARDMDMVHLLNSIAYAMEGQEDYAQAVIYLEAAHDNLRKLSENDQRLRGDWLLRNAYYLAGACEKAGNMKKALIYYNEALSLLGESQTAYYPTCLNNAANVMTELGDADGALELRLKAMEQIKSVIGPRSVSYAQSLKNLAVMYRSRKNYEKAKELMREAIEIKQAILGINSRETIREVLFLIELLTASEETEKALEIFMRLLAEVGDDFDGHEEILNEFAELYMRLGDINRLNELYNKAVEMHTKTQRDNEDS